MRGEKVAGSAENFFGAGGALAKKDVPSWQESNVESVKTLAHPHSALKSFRFSA
jgi:hypothetical protein